MANNFKEKPIKIRIAEIVILVLTLILALLVVVTISIYSDYVVDYSYSENSFLWNLEEEDYASLIEDYHYNVDGHQDNSDALKEYYETAKYAEAAYYYRAFSDVGNTEKAKLYRERMEEAEKGMGEFSFHAEKICERLGIWE